MRYEFDGKQFGKDIHMARWERAMTMEEVGSRVGASRAAVCRWENAKQDPPILAALVLCRLFRLEIFAYIKKVDTGQMDMPGFEFETEGEFFENQTISMFEYEDEPEPIIMGRDEVDYRASQEERLGW